jgi:hypothetical protein
MPPTIVIPEIAFVMAMRGECRACVTPATQELPTQQERAKVLIMEELGTPAAMKRAELPAMVANFADSRYFPSKSGTSAALAACASSFSVGGGGGGGT